MNHVILYYPIYIHTYINTCIHAYTYLYVSTRGDVSACILQMDVVFKVKEFILKIETGKMSSKTFSLFFLFLENKGLYGRLCRGVDLTYIHSAYNVWMYLYV